MSVTRSFRLFRLTILTVSLTLTLSGCIQAKLKKLEIRQLEGELAGMKELNSHLSTKPQLGTNYDARLFVSGSLFNRFLDGMRDYNIQLDNPRGAILTIEQTSLAFKDGPPEVSIALRARNRKGDIEIKMRMRAVLEMVADPDKGEVNLSFVVKEIVPDVRLSIFRLRQLWFVGGLLRIEADKYATALPATRIPIQADLPIAFDPAETGEISLGSEGKLYVKQRLPRFQLAYRYKANRVITLRDGVHIFFNLERVQ